MNSYLALLRGINVGGKNMIKMTELTDYLEKAGLQNVRTYIQSGNVLFESPETDSLMIAKNIEQTIKRHFQAEIGVVVISKDRWQKIIASAPKEWGIDKTWKHNLLILLEPYDMRQVRQAIGELKPDIESLEVGDGVLYQSMSLALFGRTTTGKLTANPVYKRLTIRNYNTAHKLLALMESA